MQLSRLVLAMTLASPAALVSAAVDQPATAAPVGTEATRYCLRLAALTGSNVETVQCWTRTEWATQGVDVDDAWSKDGVRAID